MQTNRCERVIRSRPADFVVGVEQRDESDVLYIEGYFAVFGDVYELWPGATESIERGAFAGVIGGDVRALVNHDTTLVIGRTKNGTLALREDERGLFGRVVLNRDDTEAMNVYARIKRGDVDQCSFAFEVAEERTEMRPDGTVHWTITRVDPLYEVSPVTFPAYEATSIAARKRDYDAITKRQTDEWRARARKRLEEGRHGT